MISILGSRGYFKQLSDPRAEDFSASCGGNAGNLLFQFATSGMFDEPARYINRNEHGFANPSGLLGSKYLVFPAANHVDPDRDISDLADYLVSTDKALIVIGLGVQAEQGCPTDLLVDRLKENSSQRRFLELLRERAAFISVRGRSSLAVLRAFGIGNVLALGCPSICISDERALGSQIASQLSGFRLGLVEPKIHVAAASLEDIQAHPQFALVERRLCHWSILSDGYYIQQSGGSGTFESFMGTSDRSLKNYAKELAALICPSADLFRFEAYLSRQGRMPSAAPEWISWFKEGSLVVGTRAHGVLAAIAAGIPGILLTHDARTEELAACMHLPSMPLHLARECQTVKTMLESLKFDSKQFDTYRQRCARDYAQTFRQLGLKPSLSLTKLGA